MRRMRRGDVFRGVAIATAAVQNVLRRSRELSQRVGPNGSDECDYYRAQFLKLTTPKG
jgi:hypothetical protein